MLWIFHFEGMERWYVMGDRTLKIRKGPSRLGANLQLSYRHFKLHAFNHTLSPLTNRVNLLEF